MGEGALMCGTEVCAGHVRLQRGGNSTAVRHDCSGQVNSRVHVLAAFPVQAGCWIMMP